MRKRNLLFTTLIISSALVTPVHALKIAPPYNLNDILPGGKEVKMENFIGVTEGDTVNLEAYWVPVVVPETYSHTFNNKEIKPRIGNIVEGGETVTSPEGHIIGTTGKFEEYNGSDVNFKFCPYKEEDLNVVDKNKCLATNEGVKNAGKWDLELQTKNPDNVLIQGNMGSSVEKSNFTYYVDKFKLTKENTVITTQNVNSSNIEQKPEITVKVRLDKNNPNDLTTLVNEVDYYYYKNPTEYDKDGKNPKYTINLFGKGNYEGIIENHSYQVVVENISSAKLEIIPSKMTYTGAPLEPATKVTFGGKVLIPGIDYDVAYSNNTEIGRGTVTVTGKGNYQGTITGTFEITTAELSINVIDGYGVYNGKPQSGGARVEASKMNTPATITYGTSANSINQTTVPTFTDAGKYTVHWKAEFKGYQTKTGTLTIEIAKANNTISLDKTTYVTKPNQPIEATVTTLFPGTLTVKGGQLANYSINGNKLTITPKGTIGTEEFTVTVAGNNNYTSASVKGNLVIKGGVIKVQTNKVEVEYDGKPHTINFAVEPTDAVVKFNYNGKEYSTKPEFIDAGTYMVSYSAAKTGYSPAYGTATLVIKPKTLPTGGIVINPMDNQFTGNPIKPTVTIPGLQEGKDFIVDYSNNVLPGTGTVIIKGNGNYKGEITKDFNIVAKDELKVSVKNGIAQYSGYPTIGEGEHIAEVKVEGPANHRISYATENNGKYPLYSMPRFKDVGKHTVYYQVTAPGCITKTGSLTIEITKRQAEIPTPYPNELFYTGLNQTPSWLNYSPKFMEMGGTIKASQAGTYQTTFKLIDKTNVVWKDGTTTDKTVEWKIINNLADNKEIIKQVGVDYDKWKQLNTDDLKNTFYRPGYTQLGWVDTCKDTDGNGNKTDRKCDYSTVYDVGSSVFGAYVANQIGLENHSESGHAKPYDLYAVWTTNTYKMNYDLCDNNGCGVFAESAPTIVPYDTAFYIPNPSRPGYVFLGWDIKKMDKTPHLIGSVTTSEDHFSTPEEWAGDEIMYKNLTAVNGDTVQFTARWEKIKFNLNFDPNVASYKNEEGKVTEAILSGITAPVKIEYGKEVKLPPNGYKLSGYIFKGWMENPDPKNPGREYTDGQIVKNPDFVDWDALSKAHLSKSEIYKLLSDVKVYAKWERDPQTKLTVNFWKEKIGADGKVHDTVNYDLAGSQVYQGEAETKVEIIPYSYKGKPSSTATNGGYITDNSTNGVANGLQIKTLNGSKISLSGNTNLNDNSFKGFTAPDKVVTTIKPDGSGRVDFYYTRNNYEITYYMIGGTSSNPLDRDYQVKITLTDPQDGSLQNGGGDDGGPNNSGEGHFGGWYKDPQMTVKIYGIDGEVITDEKVYAMWEQYRYSEANGDNQVWGSWGKKQD